MDRKKNEIENFIRDVQGRGEWYHKNLHDNYKGSALLFEARAGCLRTNIFVGKYHYIDKACVVCRKETNDSTHFAVML